VRPSDLRIESRHFGDAVPARVRRVVELGARTELGLTLDDGQQLTAHLDERRAASLALSPGALVYLEPTRSYAFDWTI
jgi:ABC-type sulfate/molybdate transport systems ATPase subunit